MTQILKAKAAHVFVSFLMCTDEDAVVEKYNRVVDPIPGCDILAVEPYICSVHESDRVFEASRWHPTSSF